MSAKVKRKNKAEEVYYNCMRELYRLSVHYDGTAGDFDKLLENATIDDKGMKHIPFDDYYLDEDVFHKVLERHLQEKLRKIEKEAIKFNILLGASPTSCFERWKERKEKWEKENKTE